VSLLSRQRIVGSTNGSSAYLLSLCTSLKQAGHEIDFISPSPASFGRWPVLRLEPDMDLFASIRIRGSFRIGNVIVATDPRIACRAGGEILNRLLGRLHLRIDRFGQKAPHAIAVPLTDADRLFVASTVRPSTMILTDYAFLNETIPFALQPRTPNAVVMHDLFFSQDPARTVVLLDQEQETVLLDQADAVIAIQEEEAGIIRRLLPGKRIILAPMAVSPVAEPQAGTDGTILFVGSNTLPNIEGIDWFLEQVWPHLLQRFPQARLQIAGSCCVGVAHAARNVTLLGRVADLAPLYRDAAVVVSPLRLGSGLKIKLVEALGLGKAVIATETTLQGVKQLLEGALLQADTPTEMLGAFARLLYDRSERARLGSQALQVARQHFSTQACYRDLLEFAARTDHAPAPAPTSCRRADLAHVEKVAE
jgi:succinoglycan biosynthesis protein ExoO